jgi:hypothetical protein
MDIKKSSKKVKFWLEQMNEKLTNAIIDKSSYSKLEF